MNFKFAAAFNCLWNWGVFGKVMLLGARHDATCCGVLGYAFFIS